MAENIKNMWKHLSGRWFPQKIAGWGAGTSNTWRTLPTNVVRTVPDEENRSVP